MLELLQLPAARRVSPAELSPPAALRRAQGPQMWVTAVFEAASRQDLHTADIKHSASSFDDVSHVRFRVLCDCTCDVGPGVTCGHCACVRMHQQAAAAFDPQSAEWDNKGPSLIFTNGCTSVRLGDPTGDMMTGWRQVRHVLTAVP